MNSANCEFRWNQPCYLEHLFPSSITNHKLQNSVLHLPQDGSTWDLRLRQLNSSQNWIVAEPSDSKFGRILRGKVPASHSKKISEIKSSSVQNFANFFFSKVFEQNLNVDNKEEYCSWKSKDLAIVRLSRFLSLEQWPVKNVFVPTGIEP